MLATGRFEPCPKELIPRARLLPRAAVICGRLIRAQPARLLQVYGVCLVRAKISALSTTNNGKQRRRGNNEIPSGVGVGSDDKKLIDRYFMKHRQRRAHIFARERARYSTRRSLSRRARSAESPIIFAHYFASNFTVNLISRRRARAHLSACPTSLLPLKFVLSVSQLSHRVLLHSFHQRHHHHYYRRVALISR